jgi:tetratricopeptide (TPR) repeat protein
MKFFKTCVASAVVLALAPPSMAAQPKRGAARDTLDVRLRLALVWEPALRASGVTQANAISQKVTAPQELEDPSAVALLNGAMEPVALKWVDNLLSLRTSRAVERRADVRMSTEVLQTARKRALSLLDEEATDAAVKLLERLLEQLPKDPQVVGGLGLGWLRQGRHADAETQFAMALVLDADNASKWKSLLRTARYWKLLKQAVLERDKREYATALVTVRTAIELEPQNVEGLAVLASILYASGDPAQAEKVYRDGLAIEADNGSAIRGFTKLLVDQKRLSDALTLLDSQGRSSLDVGGRFTYLRVGILRDQADALAQSGQVGEAQAMLESAVSIEPTNAWARYDLAILLITMAPDRSRSVMDAGRKLAPRDSDMQYASALYFAKVDEPDIALACLAEIVASDITPSIDRLKRRMTIQSALLRAAAFDRSGQVAEASALMKRAQSTAGDDPDFLYSLANAWIGRGEPEPALSLFRQAIARADAPAPSLKLPFASLLNRAQQDAELATVLRGLSAQKNLNQSDRAEIASLERQMNFRIAYGHLKAGGISAARASAEQLQRDAPQDSRILILLGNIARQDGQYDEAMAYFRRANALVMPTIPASASALTEAQEEIDALERRRQPRASLAYDRRNKSGTPGISEMMVDEIPLEIRLPMGYHGHAQLNVEQVNIRAGAFDLADTYSLTRYGKVLALSPSGLDSSTPQEAKGTALVLGYEADNWRFDIGTTPVGFAVQDLVGGVRWYNSSPDFSVSLDASRRPVTSSLLSYAGASDPVTGEVWGAVRSSGASVRVAQDYDSFDASMTIGYRFLDGKNVLNNTQFEVRPQVTWTLLQDKDLRLTTGLSYTYWKFAEDLSYYTFGHGGYYSPQSYQSIALPLRWSGTNGRLSYSLDGSISASWTQSKDMPYYPTNAVLQAAAGNPVHAGGDSNGSGFSLGAAIEYQLAPSLVLGGRWEIGRAAYYAPNAAMVYLRYFLDQRAERAVSTPDVLRSSQRY